MSGWVYFDYRLIQCLGDLQVLLQYWVLSFVGWIFQQVSSVVFVVCVWISSVCLLFIVSGLCLVIVCCWMDVSFVVFLMNVCISWCWLFWSCVVYVMFILCFVGVVSIVIFFGVNQLVVVQLFSCVLVSFVFFCCRVMMLRMNLMKSGICSVKQSLKKFVNVVDLFYSVCSRIVLISFMVLVLKVDFVELCCWVMSLIVKFVIVVNMVCVNGDRSFWMMNVIVSCFLLFLIRFRLKYWMFLVKVNFVFMSVLYMMLLIGLLKVCCVSRKMRKMLSFFQNFFMIGVCMMVLNFFEWMLNSRVSVVFMSRVSFIVVIVFYVMVKVMSCLGFGF